MTSRASVGSYLATRARNEANFTPRLHCLGTRQEILPPPPQKSCSCIELVQHSRVAVGSKLDITQAYQMEEDSQKSVTINTHQYQYTRLLFGIASTPAIFQDTVLQRTPQTVCYNDSILVTGATNAEHLQNLEEVLFKTI